MVVNATFLETLEKNHLDAILAAAGLLIVCFFVFRRMGRNRRASPERAVRERGTSAEPAHALRGDAERLLVELQEFGREIEGRLETRIQHLSRLIAEADKAVARLNAAVAASEGKGPQKPRDPVKAKIVALAGEGRTVEDIAQALSVPKGEVELVLDFEKRR